MNSPILFIIFNRPDLTKITFDAIRQIQPPKLYISADGPRDKHNDVTRCESTRLIVDKIDWKCEVHRRYNDTNLGCKMAVSSAISWFFEHEEEGIIIEDDCLPTKSFFYFCDELLSRYRYDTRIWQISGTNYFSESISTSDSDYFFSRYGPIWGWATWRRAWNLYDPFLSDWRKMSCHTQLKNVYPNKIERYFKLNIGNSLHSGIINTWDYQWGIIKNYNSALSIIPNKNLVLNIGFRDDATHTTTVDTNIPKLSFEMTAPINHPHFIIPESDYEENFLKIHFPLREYIIKKYFENFKNYILNLFKNE